MIDVAAAPRHDYIDGIPAQLIAEPLQLFVRHYLHLLIFL